MRILRHLTIAVPAVLAAGLCVAVPSPAAAQDDAVPELNRRLAERIRAWHEGAPENGEFLKVVYFHPSDAPPQAGHDERLTRILTDIRDFFRDEMHGRHGFAGELPLELNGDSKVVLHMVEGDDPGDKYTYKNGDKVRREIAAALAGTIDFENDFVLVIGGLCQKRDDGSYFFHSPYYGAPGSNHRWGLCYAADCERLDTIHISADAVSEKFAYEEHLGSFTKTLAHFNALYIGGLAHELGHGLSLPHNGQQRQQRQSIGTALMGSGNHTYRHDVFSDRKGSFMTLASTVRLATHPLFTGSDRGRDDAPNPADTTRIEMIEFKAEGNLLELKGTISSSADLPALALIAYQDPEGGGGYDALTSVAEIDAANGAFKLEAPRHGAGNFELRLTVVHPNGATITPLKLPYSADSNSGIDVAMLTSAWHFDPIERLWLEGEREAARKLAETTTAKLGATPFAAELERLFASAKPQPENDSLEPPAQAQGESLALSAAKWRNARVGWGEPMRDYYFHGPSLFRDAVLLRPGGEFHPAGLYAHAPARHDFELGGKWKTFTAVAGLQRGVLGGGQARFIVVGDGRELFRSDVLKGRATADIRVDVSSVDVLELITESAKEGNGGCWSVWGSPTLAR